MIDQDLDLVGTAFADVRLDGDAHDVISRGRTLRRRRKAIPALATAGILAASLSLAVVTQSSPPAAGSQALGYHGAVVNVDEAGFSIHTDVKTGGVTLRLSQIFDEAAVKALLAKAGVPAVFHNAVLSASLGAMPAKSVGATPVNECTWTGVRTLDSGDVVSILHPDSTDMALTIYPAKMPADSVIGLQYATIGTAGKVEAGFVSAPTLLSGEPTGCVFH